MEWFLALTALALFVWWLFRGRSSKEPVLEIETRHYKTEVGPKNSSRDGSDYYKEATALKKKGDFNEALEKIKRGIETDESKGWIAFDGRKKFVNYAVLAKQNNDAWAMIQNTIHLLYSEDDPSRYQRFVEFYHLECKLLLKEKRFKNLLLSSCTMERYHYLIYKEWGEHLYRKAMEGYKTAKEKGWEATKPTREKASLRWQLKNYPRLTEYPPEFLVKALKGFGMEDHVAEFANVIEENLNKNPLAMEKAIAALMDRLGI